MLYFKKTVEWVKGCFSLVGLVSFFAGVYSLALVDLFYFSNEITPPAFSAAFAGGALILAGYTAVKVRYWLKNKINETGFKQCELIMESLRCIIIEMNYTHNLYKRLMKANEENKEVDRIAKDLEPVFKKFLEKTHDLLVIIESLPSWNVKLVVKPIIKKSIKLLNDYSYSTTIRSILAMMKNETSHHKIISYAIKNSNQFLSASDTVIYRLQGILSVPYDKKFKPDSHHT